MSGFYRNDNSLNLPQTTLKVSEIHKTSCTWMSCSHITSRYPLAPLVNNTDATLRGWFEQIETSCCSLPVFTFSLFTRRFPGCLFWFWALCQKPAGAILRQQKLFSTWEQPETMICQNWWADRENSFSLPQLGLNQVSLTQQCLLVLQIHCSARIESTPCTGKFAPKGRHENKMLYWHTSPQDGSLWYDIGKSHDPSTSKFLPVCREY